MDLMNLDVDEDDDFIGIAYEIIKQNKSYLQNYGMEKKFQITVFTWMTSLGRKYCEFHKNYYVNNNKNEANVIYRWYFA